ncbi:flagellar hook-length control protein FliK [Sphingopyxis sp. PAMC25046]|uniref:flagellar hook-length control protein FliK n=1 Tax=Sphingopyxis sp. PAMC25046 TaxID=2565556 RepID=UPI00109DD5FC|nr:flagellar hook-length control protein FliK [Sphingopyxis sp. PAMC25046]QCB53088.1 flagellar hook-length control protein FliK [Sphingopyxis sp. PAMC25046]
MMGAPSLPTPQGAMPAGFATFLANIGQLPDGGEGGGFDQLLAAAPVTGAPSAAAPITKAAVAIVAVPTAEAPQIDTPPLKAAVSVEAPFAKAEPAETNPAALAATLLVALGGNVPGTPAPGKPAPAETEADTAPNTAEPGEPGEAVASAVPATNLAAVVATAIPAATKPAKPVEAPQVRADADTPATPVTARPRDASAPLPILAGAEAPVAKPVDAAPSMTILFAQPAAQGTAMAAEAAAPAQIAERVLDMDSDGAWIDQLARDIAATKSDSGDISFRLMPRHLGRLDVAMQMGDEGVALKMDTHHEATATIVTAAQGRLVEELRQQGVRVAGAEVTCTPGETGRQSQSQGQGQDRSAAADPAHLIETATERAEPRDEARAADRRGRFA